MQKSLKKVRRQTTAANRADERLMFYITDSPSIEENPGEVGDQNRSDPDVKDQPSLYQECAEDSKFQSFLPCDERDEAAILYAYEQAELSYVESCSGEDRKIGKGKKRRGYSLAIAEKEHSVEPDPCPSEPHFKEDAAPSDDVVSIKGPEDMPAEELSAEEIPPDSDSAVAEDATFCLTPVGGAKMDLPAASIAVDDECLAAPAAEEPCPEPSTAEAREEVPERPPSTCPSPCHIASGADPTDEPQATKKYTIGLKIIHDTQVLSSIASLNSCSKTAILNKAQAVCSKHIPQYKRKDAGRRRACDDRLVSVLVDNWEFDLSTYDSKDMTFLIQTISKTSIPRFTVELSQF
jgi:hypothetical protein